MISLDWLGWARFCLGWTCTWLGWTRAGLELGRTGPGLAGPGRGLGWTRVGLELGRTAPGLAGPGLGPRIWHSFKIGPIYNLVLSCIVPIIKSLHTITIILSLGVLQSINTCHSFAKLRRLLLNGQVVF